MELNPSDVTTLTEIHGPAEQIRVERDGYRDLSFQGWELSEGSVRYDSWNGRVVKVYLTVGGNLVTEVCDWARVDNSQDARFAAVHREPADAYRWLLDEEGRLKPAEKEAWELACKAYPALGDWETEPLD